MLKKYIGDYLNQKSLSEEQKSRVETLLYDFGAQIFSDIQQDEELFQKLVGTEQNGDRADLTVDMDKTQNMETSIKIETEDEDRTEDFQASLDSDPELETRSFLNENTEDLEPEKIQDRTADLSSKVDSTEYDKKESRMVSLKPFELQLGERYEDLGLLGKGGMGEVRRVRDKVLNRRLAMKIIHSNVAADRNSLVRFVEEAQVGAQLQHQNIVPVYDLGKLPDGRSYFTMKEIKGIEFKELIKGVHAASTDMKWRPTKEGITFRRLIQIFHQICETMAFAHSMNVIHRDLKPSNIMIGDFGEVLVVDWGLAKVLDSEEELDSGEEVQTNRTATSADTTQMGVISGTPSYMSPEQAMGRVDLVTKPSDVYTLGVILYYILVGHPPYKGKTALDVIEKVKLAEPPDLLRSVAKYKGISGKQNIGELEKILGKIPLSLVEICKKAMEKHRGERYQSAAELTQELSDWLEGAQKRDKALKEYEVAVQKCTQAEEAEKRYSLFWQEANEIIQKNGFEQNSSWTRWLEGKEAQIEAMQLRREYRDNLRDSLVYDFSLEEANEAMAKLVLDEIILAVANGEKRQREILEKQFNNYLQYLPQRKQEELQLSLSKKRKDEIVLLRARRGELVGRTKLREEITQALFNQSRLISLVGTAGVGKTRLALEAIYDLQEESTQTYFCNLTEANSELGVALFVAKAMNIQLRNVDPIGQLGELFAKQKTILVLDNLEQVVGPVGKVIIRWMEQAETLRIIATSRVKLRLPMEFSFPIQPLSALEGIELFTKRGQKADSSFFLQEENRVVVGKLVQQLDNLPLAIELGAARLNIFSVSEIAERLGERFSLLRSRDKETQALQGALDWSWDLLKPWAKAALSQTSVFRSGFEFNAAENVLNVGDWKGQESAIFDILQDLVDDSLLLQTKSEDGSIRYGLLESIRQYSQSKLTDEEAISEQGLSGQEACKQTQRRHAGYYSRFGEKKFLDGLDNQDNQSVWKGFLDELDNFVVGTEYGEGKSALGCCLAALKILGMKGPVSLGIDIAGEVLELPSLSNQEKKQLQIIRTRFLRISGRMKEARETQEKKEIIESFFVEEKISFSKNMDAEKALKSNEDEPAFDKEQLRLGAEKFLENGNIEKAESNYERASEIYQEALKIFSKINDIKGMIQTHINIGEVLGRQSNNEAAFEVLYFALKLAEEHDFFLLKAEVLNSIGTLYFNQSEYEKAIEYYQKALDINQRLGNKSGEGNNIGNIGAVYSKLGNYEEAISYHKQALDLAKQIGDKNAEGIQLGSLGVIYRHLGNYEETISYYKQALELAEKIGNRLGEGKNLGNLGVVYFTLGNYEEAISHYQQALVVNREIGLKRFEGINLGNLGLVYQKLGQYEEAISYYKKALKINQKIGNKREEGNNLGALGLVYSDLGNVEEAISYYQRSLKVVQETGNKRSEGRTLGNIGVVYFDLGNHEKAVSYYQQSLKIARETGNRISEGINLGNIGSCHFILGKYGAAQETLNQAIEICADALPLAAGAFYGSLALVQSKQNELEEALKSIEKGEPLVSEIPSEHGKFLCKKAKVFQLANQRTKASEALFQAQKIAKELKIKEDSELGRDIKEAEEFLTEV